MNGKTREVTISEDEYLGLDRAWKGLQGLLQLLELDRLNFRTKCPEVHHHA
jgi:hypothetical protein